MLNLVDILQTDNMHVNWDFVNQEYITSSLKIKASIGRY